MNKKIKKSLAVLMSIAMLMSAFAPNIFAAIDASLLWEDTVVTAEREYKLVSGVIQKDIVLNSTSGDSQNNCFVLEVDLNNPDVSIVAGYNDGDADGWGRIPVRDQAYALEETRDVNVIAAINGDFHNTSTGEPAGILVMNGVLGHKPNARPFFAILKDGTAAIMDAGSSLDNVQEAIGGGHILVRDGKNVAPNDKLQPRTAIGIKADGSVVMFIVDGRQAPSSRGMNYPELAAAMIALGCVEALELDGGGSSTLLAQREASSDLECRNSPSYGYERKVATSLAVCTTAKPTGIFDHIAFSETTYMCAPYSSVRISTKGVDVNGYEAALPSGGSLKLRDTSYGSFNGSSFRSNGKVGTTIIDYVLDGEVIASAMIEITEEADNIFESLVKQMVQFITNIFNMFNLLIEKLFPQAIVK